MIVVFDEIDNNENTPRVLADLNVSRCNGPRDSLVMHDVCTKHFNIDSGAYGNLIPLSLYLELFPNSCVNNLKPTTDHRVQLVVYNKNLIKQHGTCYLNIRSNGHMYICKFYVIDSHFNPIICVGSCLKLGLIQFQTPVYAGWNDGQPVSIGEHVDAVGTKKTMKMDDVPARNSNAKSMGEHRSVQTTNSKENDGGTVPSVLTKDWIVTNPKYKIEMKPDVEPVRKAARRVPLALKDRFTKEIQSMVDSGISIKLIPGMPTPEWLNSFIIVKMPNGNLKVCLDPTSLNKSIIRPVCNMRTLEEIIDLLKGSVYFAVFDSTKSFFHVPIDDDSKQLTVMLTPIGIYLYTILAMGLLNATDIFETCMRNIVDGLQRVVNIADDILVFASDYDTFKSNVVSFLDHCVEHNLHLNPDKIHINVDSIPFFGQMLTKQGLMMDENKWRVIQDWPVLTNIKELQSFLGSVNYLSKFIPYLSIHRKYCRTY